MQLVHEFNHALLRGMCAALLVAAAAPAAQANWLARLAREAGEAGGSAATRAARYGISGLDRTAAYVKALPSASKGAVLAAHATPEGHWKFVNREGEVFTAGTPDELRRAVPTLLPDAPSDAKLALYLTEDTVFGERAFLKDLPEGAALHVVVGRDSYPLVRGAEKGTLLAEVRPHLRVALKDAGLFEEAVAQLERPLSRANIRTLALEPGGPAALSSSPRLEPSTRAALVDRIDPAGLAGALHSVRGQTVLATGRTEDNLLYFRPENGPEQSLKILDMIRAAEAADVNLVILQAPVPRQPGGRNWLWQRIAVDGLDDALKRATFGDFLDALGASRGAFRVTVAREGKGRVAIRAAPEDSGAEPITDVVGEWLSNITGNVVTSGVVVHARDEARQQELDRRIIPFIPSDYQIAYIVGLVAGVMGWPVARAWWDRLWPAEQRSEYRGLVGYRAAQAARLLAFLLLFLPVAGLPALFVALILQLFGIAMLPFRFLRWIMSGSEAKVG